MTTETMAPSAETTEVVHSSFTVAAPVLRDLIARAALFVAGKDEREPLQHIQVAIQRDGVRFTACNGYAAISLHADKNKLQGALRTPPYGHSFLATPKSLEEAVKGAKSYDELNVIVTNDSVFVQRGSRQTTLATSSSIYPNVGIALRPEAEDARQLFVNHGSLVGEVAGQSDWVVLSEAQSGTLFINQGIFHQNKRILLDYKSGIHIETTIGSVCGDHLDIKINAHFWRQAVSALQYGPIRIGWADKRKPLLLRDMHGATVSIMPMSWKD